MQYIFLIYGDESAWGSASPEEQAKNMQEWSDYTQFLKDKGYHIAGDALHPTSDATTVRVRDGKTITTDGPFAETKEQLMGFWIIEAQNLDEALAWTRKAPLKEAAIEIRPLVEEQGEEDEKFSAEKILSRVKDPTR